MHCLLTLISWYFIKSMTIKTVMALTSIDLLELEGLNDLPAVKWKLLNISKMDPAKHRKAVHKLRDYPGVWIISSFIPEFCIVYNSSIEHYYVKQLIWKPEFPGWIHLGLLIKRFRLGIANSCVIRIISSGRKHDIDDIDLKLWTFCMSPHHGSTHSVVTI